MATNISNEDYEKWAAYIKKDFSGQSWETTLEAYKKRVDDLAKKVRELSVPKKRYFSTSENLVKAGATALSLGITGFSVSVKGMNISITGLSYGQDVVWRRPRSRRVRSVRNGLGSGLPCRVFRRFTMRSRRMSPERGWSGV